MKRLLIGIGNPFRRDDGVGIHIAEKMRTLLPQGIDVLTQSGEGATLMQSWLEADQIVVVDAVRSQSTPGKIHEINAATHRVPSEFFHYSSHAFGVAEAIELSRVLNQLPRRVDVIGIEGKDFSEGIGLTAEVDAAAEQAIAKISSLLGEMC